MATNDSAYSERATEMQIAVKYGCGYWQFNVVLTKGKEPLHGRLIRGRS